jgi:hypothetical protein
MVPLWLKEYGLNRKIEALPFPQHCKPGRWSWQVGEI